MGAFMYLFILWTSPRGPSCRFLELSACLCILITSLNLFFPMIPFTRHLSLFSCEIYFITRARPQAVRFEVRARDRSAAILILLTKVKSSLCLLNPLILRRAPSSLLVYNPLKALVLHSDIFIVDEYCIYHLDTRQSYCTGWRLLIINEGNGDFDSLCKP